MMSDESEQSSQGSGTEGDSETDMTTSSDSSSSESPPPLLMAYSFEPSATGSESSPENSGDDTDSDRLHVKMT